jgi:uncharacterized membrane protein
VSLPRSVSVAAGGTADVPLVLTSDAFVQVGDYGFTVTAGGDNGASASVSGDLVLQGRAAPPDAQSHGVVVTLIPTQASAGQGTLARYEVRLTNTGSTDDSFTLSTTGIPAGLSAGFGQTTVDVPPGASNFRDVALTLTPKPGTALGADPFTVVATSTSKPAITAAAGGTAVVLANGVGLSLNPPSGAPGGKFAVTVTNTGNVKDTFDLSLAGPAALVATLATKTVTLSPGASQSVAITMGAVDFALAGALNLTAMATSRGNPAVKLAATSSLSIPATQRFTAQFSPTTETLPKPGTGTFLLLVNNTGNQEDSYTAFITGTSGAVTANLVGLDGLPTQSILVFRLPGLSTGAILLQTNLTAVGQGAVTVEVKSLTNGAIVATATATVTAGNGTSPLTDGPRITKVLRYGIHWQPTTLVLVFDQPLDPTSSQNVNNYAIIDPHGHRVAISSAVYDPAALTVTLHPSRRLNFHYGYKLSVNGEAPGGLTDTQGLLLDGHNDGKPGGNYVTVVNRHNLVLGVSTPKVTHHLSPTSGQRSTARRRSSMDQGKVVVAKSASRPADHDSHTLLGGSAAAQKDSARKRSHVKR